MNTVDDQAFEGDGGRLGTGFRTSRDTREALHAGEESAEEGGPEALLVPG